MIPFTPSDFVKYNHGSPFASLTLFYLHNSFFYFYPFSSKWVYFLG